MKILEEGKMIFIKGNHTERTGTGKEITADIAKALYYTINEAAKASSKPFISMAEEVITVITTAVLDANEAVERENK